MSGVGSDQPTGSMSPGEATYPGTDLALRLCYGCAKTIESLDDMWLDSDEDCVVCTDCKIKAELDYPESHHRPARDFLPSDIAEVQGGEL